MIDRDHPCLCELSDHWRRLQSTGFLWTDNFGIRGQCPSRLVCVVNGLIDQDKRQKSLGQTTFLFASLYLWWGRVWKWFQNVSWSQCGGAGQLISSVWPSSWLSNRRRRHLNSPGPEWWSDSRWTLGRERSLPIPQCWSSSECSRCGPGSTGRLPCWGGAGPSHSPRTGPPSRLRWPAAGESPIQYNCWVIESIIERRGSTNNYTSNLGFW